MFRCKLGLNGYIITSSMDFIKKHKTEFLVFAALFAIFLFTRLYNIMALPIFTDEAIYVRWAQIAKNDATWRFISLTDGKQPSFVWAAMIIMRFVQDPLFAGRLVSVIAGLFSMVGLFFLGKELFKSKVVGILASGLYVILPMALVYDRIALYDSLVGAFAVWSLYLEVLLIRRMRLDVALILGMVAGGAVLTKSNGFFTVYLLPFSLLLFNLQKTRLIQRLTKWLGLALLAVLLTYAFYSILRLSPFVHIIDQKNALFVYPFNEWVKHPWLFFYGNLLGVWDWFHTYLTWPIVFLITASFFIYRQFTREKLLLFLWFVLPFVALALFGRVLYPRFIFFMVLPLLPLAALTLVKLSQVLKTRLKFALLLALFLILTLRADYYILTDFANAPIPASDVGQYINSVYAGGGIEESIEFFRERAKNEKIFIATEGTFGLMPASLEIYLVDNPNIEIKGYWPLYEKIPEEVLQKSKEKETYFVFNETQKVPNKWPLTFIAKFQKGESDVYLFIYRVNP